MRHGLAAYLHEVSTLQTSIAPNLERTAAGSVVSPDHAISTAMSEPMY